MLPDSPQERSEHLLLATAAAEGVAQAAAANDAAPVALREAHWASAAVEAEEAAAAEVVVVQAVADVVPLIVS